MEIGLLVAKGEWKREKDVLGVWGWQMQTITLRMDKQQGLIQHRELYPVSWDKSQWKRILKKKIYICKMNHSAVTAEIGKTV